MKKLILVLLIIACISVACVYDFGENGGVPTPDLSCNPPPGADCNPPPGVPVGLPTASPFHPLPPNATFSP